LSESPHRVSRPTLTSFRRRAHPLAAGRRIAAPVTVGLVLVVAACGDDGDEEGISPFCAESQAAVAELDEQPSLDELGEAWRQVEEPAPESISDDWDLVLERWDELANPPQPDTEGELDLEEAEARAERGRELDLAWRSVSTYLRDVCEMQLP
jgi:hypothetical protein